MAGTLRDYVGYGTLGARPASPGITTVTGGSARYFATDTGTEYAWSGSAWVAVGGGSGMYSAYLMYQDQEANTTAGGTFTSGAWRTRVLNTEVADTANHGTLASNQITLDAGTYRVAAAAPAFNVNRNQLRLQNITDTATLVLGQNASAIAGVFDQTSALLVGRFTIAAAKVIELQHQCQTTEATDGLGIAMSFGGSEIYAQIEMWKE